MPTAIPTANVHYPNFAIVVAVYPPRFKSKAGQYVYIYRHIKNVRTYLRNYEQVLNRGRILLSNAGHALITHIVLGDRTPNTQS